MAPIAGSPAKPASFSCLSDGGARAGIEVVTGELRSMFGNGRRGGGGEMRGKESEIE